MKKTAMQLLLAFIHITCYVLVCPSRGIPNKEKLPCGLKETHAVKQASLYNVSLKWSDANDLCKMEGYKMSTNEETIHQCLMNIYFNGTALEAWKSKSEDQDRNRCTYVIYNGSSFQTVTDKCGIKNNRTFICFSDGTNTNPLVTSQKENKKDEEIFTAGPIAGVVIGTFIGFILLLLVSILLIKRIRRAHLCTYKACEETQIEVLHDNWIKPEEEKNETTHLKSKQEVAPTPEFSMLFPDFFSSEI